MGVAALLTGGFMLAEIVGGLFAGSLALLADAGHMLTDFASLSLAWLGFRLTRRPADWRRTYGFDRFAVLVAFVNGIALFAIAAWILTEAVQRLNAPVTVLGAPMLWIAATGLGVNVLSFFVLRSGDRDNLNIRAAVLHVIGDLLGSVAAVVAALVILTTGWTPIDPLLSIVVALIILRSAWSVVADSSHILLDGSPPDVDSRALREGCVPHCPSSSTCTTCMRGRSARSGRWSRCTRGSRRIRIRRSPCARSSGCSRWSSASRTRRSRSSTTPAAMARTTGDGSNERQRDGLRLRGTHPAQ